ncbi:uncharacterized protein LOC143288073 isoform X3 [Babylonia areolata]|uniref:uncharacterized protein LOC143288073 isoform X3 n=1 Tax=Babylonia areolata TaxID=304850 RepID=UPI003FD149BA
MGSCQNPTAAENLLQVPDALRSISKLYNWPPKKSACRHYMLLCKVLLGDSAPAQRTYRSPPRIRNSKRRYDSCFGVDQNHAEDLAVYDGSQVFPEYIIEYECPAHYPLVSPREPVTLTSPNAVLPIRY